MFILLLQPRWGLASFLQNKSKEPTTITKPPSIEAPASEQSEDLDEAEKRAADQVISDENPPSNDQDLMCKRAMSADEFSPPAPIDKHPVLSPIKSPQAVKSPAKRSYSRKNNADKLATSVNAISDSMKFGNTYDSIKSRERKTSQSKASPGLSDCDKPISRKGRRKTKQKKSQAFVTHDSESESETENISHSSDSVNSPHKLISPQKSLHISSMPGNTVCSSKPVTSSAKRRESKDKLIREKDSIKLKAERTTIVPDKLTDCDSSKAASKVPHFTDTLPVDEMLDSFTVPGKTPLSPIPNLPHIDIKCQTDEHLRKAGLAVSTVKPAPINGNISYNPKGKPSVLVKIDLNLLCNYLCVERSNPNFLKPIANKSDFIHQKVTSAKSNLPKVTKNRKSQKVLNEIVSDNNKVSASKSVPNRTSPSNSASISNEKSSVGTKSSNFKSNDKTNNSESRKASNSAHVKKESECEIPDFDSLPVKEVKEDITNHNSDDSEDSDSGSSGSSGSSSSSSDSESDNEQADSKAASVSPAHDYEAASSRHSADVDIKKRKLEVTRPEDSKRRKTVVPDSPRKHLASEVVQR